jgi:periplasmic protein CpxP/Spy
MEDQDTGKIVSPSSASGTRNAKKKRRFFAGVITGGLLGGLLASSLTAWSNNDGGAGGGQGRGWCRHSSASPEAQRERMEFATDWMLNKVKATADQREKVKAIVAATLKDLADVREQHRENRDAFLAALAQPTVDRATLDQLRQSELHLADTASQRIVTTLADVSDVLTPEQRGELVKLAEQLRR